MSKLLLATWVSLLLVSSGSSQTLLPFTGSGPGGTIVDPGFPPSYPNFPPSGSGMSSPVTVPNNVARVDSITITTIVHPYKPDVHAILRDPTGKGHNLFVRPGFTTGTPQAGSFTTGGNPGSTVTLIPSGGGSFPQIGNVATGVYLQTYGVSLTTWPSGTANLFNTNLAAITGPPGSWSLQIWDWGAGNTGSIQGWTLSALIVKTGDPLCFGDGTSGACVCGNTGAAGKGCNNSVATGGARLEGTGFPELAADTVVMTSSGEGPTVPSTLLQGNALVTAVPYGDGLRCAGGILKRLYTKPASGGVVVYPGTGDLSISARSAALGDTITAGSTRWYQVSYRDPNLTFCPTPPGNSYNISSGFSVQWFP